MPATNGGKFSVSSPLQQDNAYLRLWGPKLQTSHPLGWETGVPSSKRIIEDMMRIPIYLILRRYRAIGCVVPGCGTRHGRRDEGIKQVASWGGHRCCKGNESRFIHPDAEECLDLFFYQCESISFNQIETADRETIDEKQEEDDDLVRHH
eukprot:13705897-Ditylum_brightwellii.AAC.1